MADALLTPASALAGLLAPVGPTPAGVTAWERAGLGLATVSARKGRGAALAAEVQRRFGFVLPSGPHRAGSATMAFLGIGPGRWLAVADNAGRGFAGDLAAALDGLAYVVDQSAGLAVLRISGPKARDTLAKGLPIDLHPSVFGPDGVAVSSLAHLGVTIWQAGAGPSYDVAFFRSFAGSFSHWLASSAAEFGLEVVRG